MGCADAQVFSCAIPTCTARPLPMRQRPHGPSYPKKVAMESAACGTNAVAAAWRPKEQLVKFPEQAFGVSCQTCHTSHGFKLSCFCCDKLHDEGQALTTLHQAPSGAQAAADYLREGFTSGHLRFLPWQGLRQVAVDPSKHGKVNCATCHHSKHRYVPHCTECHGSPHKKEIP